MGEMERQEKYRQEQQQADCGTLGAPALEGQSLILNTQVCFLKAPNPTLNRETSQRKPD
jgi:hypothetical protein